MATVHIERSWDGSPTFFNSKLNDGDMFHNTNIGFGDIIIDKDFIDEMESIANDIKDNNGNKNNIIELLTLIYNRLIDYYYSEEKTNLTRVEAYDNNIVIDKSGAIVGTKLSSLKGLNVAKCSEKSLAAYVILNKLFEMGMLTREPSLVLSKISTESLEPGPHAFIMLNKDNDMIKHIIFDIENPSLFEINSDGKKSKYIGLYSLTDEEYNDLVDGFTCSPKSLFELVYHFKEISEKRTYGNKQKEVNL